MIKWYWDTPTKCIKLQGNLTQKANTDGCPKLQMLFHKLILYIELTEYIFKNDKKFGEQWLQDSR